MIKEFKKGTSEKLSLNFSSGEFDCHCKYEDCAITYIDTDLIDWLQDRRNFVGKPMKVNSGFRCTKYNKKVSIAEKSYHMTGKAADLSVEGMSSKQLLELFKFSDGLGEYPGRHFVHVDVRGFKARWVTELK